MAARKFIHDLRYNGKTVEQRLIVDGLWERFQAAVLAPDESQMIEILERVAITKNWAARLAPMILEEPHPGPIRLATDDPRNCGALRLVNELKFPPCIRPIESPRDPYWHLGSHPEIVERLWDNLATVLPQDGRCIVFGTPALVAPRSGILLAQAFGTRAIVRIPPDAAAEATRLGAKSTMTWSGGRVTDLAHDYGDDWIFDSWLTQTSDWLRTAYEIVENLEPSGS